MPHLYRRSSRISAFLFLLFLPLALMAAGDSSAEPQKILMIGNSLTYTWSIPSILERFAAERNHPLKVTMHIAGGKDLLWHSTNTTKPSDLTALQDIAKGGYDLVIIQEYSNMLMKPEGRENFDRMLPEYLKAVSGASMKPMLYMAHPTRKDVDQAGIQPIIDAYSQKADEFKIPCAPAALAFVMSNEKLPHLALMDIQTDRKYAQNKVGTHQSPFGSYLAACTLYAAIFKESPVGLAFRGAFDAKTEIPIDEADAKAAQEIAWQVWQDYSAKHPAP